MMRTIVTSGQAPNTFMEVTRFKLPNTGLECSASNSLQSCFPTDHPMAKTFTPDFQLSYDDYRQLDFSKDAELRMQNYCLSKSFARQRISVPRNCRVISHRASTPNSRSPYGDGS